MIPEPNIEALKALLTMAPVRSQSDARKPVRKTMDANANLFRKLADKGHTADRVVDAFLADFPELRDSRPDLDDEAYRRHVRDTYISFRRAIGLKKPKAAAPIRATRPKVKVVEERAAAVEVAPAPVPEPQVEKPLAVPTAATNTKTNVGGIKIPTKDDL